LPAASPSAFTTYGGAISAEVRRAVLGALEDRGRGGRHAGLCHDVLREALAALDLGRGAGRPEAGDAGRPDRVGGAGHQRHLRADDDEVGGDLLRERGHRGGVGHVEGARLGERGGPGVARRAHQRGDSRIAAQRQQQGVLAGTGSDDEDLHAANTNQRLASP
jgi:hypothetical protein